MEPTYRDIVLTRVRRVIEEAEALSSIKHRGLKGQLREMLLRELFKPLFPSDLGAGTGEIVSYTGQKSPQQDVVIYNRGILPPVLYEDSSGIFAIESALYSIEVKSVLTRKDIKESHRKSDLLTSFHYSSGIYDPLNRSLQHPVEPVARALFAFGSDSKQSEVERYDEVRGDAPPSIAAICVAKKGYWYWSSAKSDWETWDVEYDLHEVVGFIAGVMNSVSRIAASRYSPRIGMYLL